MKKILGLFIYLLLASIISAADSSSTKPADSTIIDSAKTASAQVTAQLGNEESIYPLSPERQQLRNRYAHFVNIWRFVDFLSSVLILWIILSTGLSAKIRDWASVGRRKFFILWFYLAIFLVINWLLNFPFDLYRNYYTELKYGFMNQSFGGWLGDDLKGLLLGVVIGIIPAFLLYSVIARFKKWWLVFSIGAIPIMIFFVVIAPVVISPLYNKFEPLKDKQLETELLTLADKAGIQGSHVFQVDASKQSTKINAYVTGLFSTKRIVLFDTLIKGFTHDEIRFVMGHEMGHYVLNHIWIGLGAAWVLLVIMLWLASRILPGFIHRFKGRFKFERLEDVASLPVILLCLTVMSFVIQPINNGISRAIEHRADRFGMDISGVSGDVAATAFEKLSAYNLSDPNPSPIIEFWFYDHPAVQKRIDFVKNYKP